MADPLAVNMLLWREMYATHAREVPMIMIIYVKVVDVLHVSFEMFSFADVARGLCSQS